MSLFIFTACAPAPDPIPPTATPPTAIPTPADATEPSIELSATTFTIISGESNARFEIEENLRSALTGWHRGSMKTVIGTTDQVFGEITIDPADLNTSQLEGIRIDAGTFKTDDFYRTRAVQNQILDAPTYPMITFVPTEIRGLPETVELGRPVTFEIEGDLTIRDVTLSETFEVTAMLVSAEQFEGTASTVVEHASYGIRIPNVPQVDFIEDEVDLFIDFVARVPRVP